MGKRTEGCEESRLRRAASDPVQRRSKERPRRRPEEEVEFRRWEQLPSLKSRIRGLSRVVPEWPGTSITKGLGQGGRVLPRGRVRLAWLSPPKKKKRSQPQLRRARDVCLSTFYCDPRGLGPDWRLRERPGFPQRTRELTAACPLTQLPHPSGRECGEGGRGPV